MILFELIRAVFKKYNRIGPDIFQSHWKLYFKSTMKELCTTKFKNFGNNSVVRPGAYAVGCSQISIGSNVIIRPGTMLFGESDDLDESIIIEDDVMIGSGVHIYINTHKYTDERINIIDQGYFPAKQVILKKGCWIGANSIILEGVVVGENAIIAAGSLVTKSVSSRTIVAGNPAKVFKSRRR
jgi:acetyltransferase-like isoleucine patch superfamily enzyme